MGRGTHVSLFFVVMKSEYDALLQWPFSQRVTFRLINPHNKEVMNESLVGALFRTTLFVEIFAHFRAEPQFVRNRAKISTEFLHFYAQKNQR